MNYLRTILRKGLNGFNQLIRPAGFQLSRISGNESDTFRDLNPAIRSIQDRIKNISIGSAERIFTLCEAVEYVCRSDIPGAFVECGVYRGGASMAAASMFKHLGASREMHLYDTFEGMPTPTERDYEISTGRRESEVQAFFLATGKSWTKGEESEVRANIAATGYDMHRVHLHRGKVEETLPRLAPEQISILRLDTDWYESTRHELVHLWPRLSPGGVLIVDDYGHFAGARDAVDEYFAEQPLFLSRVDYTVRMAVKTIQGR